MFSREDLERAFDDYPDIKLDEVGAWTELKENIIKYYMGIYTDILSKQLVPTSRGQNQRQFEYYYIDAFCSTGVHISKKTKQFAPGSAYSAATACPPFDKYIFMDIREEAVGFLRSLLGEDSKYKYWMCDCNRELPALFNNYFRWGTFRRALCFIDPYNISVDWQTMLAAGAAGKDSDGDGSVECFINYPQHDIQRNILRERRALIEDCHSARMTKFWGDLSWEELLWGTRTNLFDDQEEFRRDESRELLLREYMRKLKDQVGFEHVVGPFPLRNSVGTDVFYLLFATHKKRAAGIVQGTFKKFRASR